MQVLKHLNFITIYFKPISTNFCKNCPDNSCPYTGDLLNWKERLTKTEETGKQKQAFYIVTADVKALYPSLCRDKSPWMCFGEAFQLQHQCAKNHCQAHRNLPKQCCHPIWRPVIYPKKWYCNRWQPLGLIGKRCCTLHPTADYWGATRGRTFPQIYRWHNLDNYIKITNKH